MRPLRKIPAGILLPLAELIFGERISLSAESDQGAALDLRFFEKNRVKLFCHYFRQKVLFVTNYLPGAFAKIVILQSRPSVAHVCASRPNNAIKSARTPRPSVVHVCASRPNNANKGAEAFRRRHCAPETG